MKNLKKTLERCSLHIQELYKEKDLGLPVITVSGSAAGIYKPELFGTYIFKKGVGDLDLSVTHPGVSGDINIKGVINIWLNSYDQILSIPAAAYSLDKRISYYLTPLDRVNKEARRMAEITSRSLESYLHPFGTYEELTGKFLNESTRMSLKRINLFNLMKAIEYTHGNLFIKYNNGYGITLHDLFKYLGSICTYWIFKDESSLLPRRDAIEELSKNSKRVEECWYYIRRKWDEGEITVKNPKEIEGFMGKCSKFLPK